MSPPPLQGKERRKEGWGEGAIKSQKLGGKNATDWYSMISIACIDAGHFHCHVN
jgi:hypothetical protein